MTQLTWLVTGCSSGFGEAFVHEILARGDNVIATARNASTRLGHLEAAGATILDLDVTASEVIIGAKVQEALTFYGSIDVLVNNAGIFDWGLIEETSPEDIMKQFDTNFLGIYKMTRAILPEFRKKKDGKLVFVGSANGWRAGAGCGAYSVSKFALEGFVETLQQETAQFNIQSIVFEPGQFRTTVLSSASLPSQLAADPDYAKLAAEIQTDLIHSDGIQNGDPRKGVQRMVDVVKQEGMAAGKAMPVRMPIGADCLKYVREKCVQTLKLCQDWTDLIESTDFGDK